MPPAPTSVGGDHIVIQGDVGLAANVGSGSVTADTIAGGDMLINQDAASDGPERVAELMADLRVLLEQAKDRGEFEPLIAKQALHNLDSAANLVAKDPKPPKSELLNKLEAVARLIGSGLDILGDDKSPASILFKALPIAVMLIKLATHVF
jgi:hypothetical protein